MRFQTFQQWHMSSNDEAFIAYLREHGTRSSAEEAYNTYCHKLLGIVEYDFAEPSEEDDNKVNVLWATDIMLGERYFKWTTLGAYEEGRKSLNTLYVISNWGTNTAKYVNVSETKALFIDVFQTFLDLCVEQGIEAEYDEEFPLVDQQNPFE